MTERELLESDALRAFGVFAEHRNFTTAAAALQISQPALHVKIRKLAAGLGVELYERHGRGLVLTAVGQRLAEFATDAGQRAEEFTRSMHERPPTMTVAAGRGAFRWVIADAIRAVTAAGRQVKVITADRDSALATLSSGHADVAVVGFDPPPRTVRSRQIARYPQVLMIDAGHALAARRRLRLADLDGLGLVVPSPDRSHRRALERALSEARVAWRPVAEADDWDLLVHFAALGVGATVVNGCVPAPAGLVGVPIVDLPAVRYWAAWRVQRHPDPPQLLEHLHPVVSVGIEP